MALVRAEIRSVSAYSVPSEPLPLQMHANENPFPLPPDVREIIAEELAKVELNRYPEPTCSKLREAIAAHDGADPERIVVGSGSDEVIALLMTALSRPSRGRVKASVLVPTPTFGMYRINALAHGLELLEVPLDRRWDLDVEAMLDAADAHHPNLVFLATPNNPTGNVFSDERLRAIVETCPRALVVLDEAYCAFAGKSLTDWCDRYPNVAAIGSLSKLGLAAARVGWVQLPRPLVPEIHKVRQPFNVNALSQAVATLVLRRLMPLLREQISTVVEQRQRLQAALERFERCTVYPSDANFLLVHYEGDMDVLGAALRQHGVQIRAYGPDDGRLAGHLRITVGTPAENRVLLEVFDALPD